MRKSYILVADDDADDRFLLQTAFEEKGFKDKLVFVENGVALLEYLERIQRNDSTNYHFPGVILLDLNMPKKDGKQALSEIKRHSAYKMIPVIVYTTTRNEMEVRTCYELGANTYIVKPARFERLLNVVDSLRNYWMEVATVPGH